MEREDIKRGMTVEVCNLKDSGISGSVSIGAIGRVTRIETLSLAVKFKDDSWFFIPSNLKTTRKRKITKCKIEK